MAYCVYLLASKKYGTLYLGGDERSGPARLRAPNQDPPGFTARYGVNKLVRFEIHDAAEAAITREKELKKWRRDWKIRLIEESTQSGLISIPVFPTKACGYGFRARAKSAPRNDERRLLPHAKFVK